MTETRRLSASRIKALEDQQKALELRRMAKGYQEIAHALGIGVATAHRHVQSALAESRAQISAEADELRSEELSRLDAMTAGLWPRARKGEAAAVDRMLKIMERRAKLLGLDAPERRELSGAGGGPIQAVGMSADEFRAIAAEIAART
jgi:vacuolar-type H+-ATPase subunit H